MVDQVEEGGTVVVSTGPRSYRTDGPMTLETAAAQIRNDVYAGARLLEDREAHELGYGHAHHQRQHVSEFGVMMLINAWGDRDEAEAYAKQRWGLSLEALSNIIDAVANPRVTASV